MESVIPTNSIMASRKVCGMMQTGMAGVFGPNNSPALATHIQSMAKVFHMPHIESRWDYNLGTRPPYSLNVHPHPAIIDKAYFFANGGWLSNTFL